MYGNLFGEPHQQQPGAEGGPLAGLQEQVAGVLNAAGNENRVYIPAGDSEPIFQAPNPQRIFLGGYWATPAPVSPQPPGGRPTGPPTRAAVAFLVVAAAFAAWDAWGHVWAVAGAAVAAVMAVMIWPRRVRPSGRAAR
jgi:hypothetical protein